MFTPGPGRRKIASADGHRATHFFTHFFAIPVAYKKLLQIRPVSGRLPTKIHEKMREKWWFRLATHTSFKQVSGSRHLPICFSDTLFSLQFPFNICINFIFIFEAVFLGSFDFSLEALFPELAEMFK
jgi:hypothetical protein